MSSAQKHLSSIQCHFSQMFPFLITTIWFVCSVMDNFLNCHVPQLMYLSLDSTFLWWCASVTYFFASFWSKTSHKHININYCFLSSQCIAFFLIHFYHIFWHPPSHWSTSINVTYDLNAIKFNGQCSVLIYTFQQNLTCLLTTSSWSHLLSRTGSLFSFPVCFLFFFSSQFLIVGMV